MTLSRGLLVVSAAVFALTAIGYLVAPGVMLSIVGVESGAATEFLLRTEGVALACGAGLLWAASRGDGRVVSLALVAVGGYYIVGSLVDLAAYAQGVVGPASVPSGAVRLLLGGLCLVAAARSR